jgi:hypothetical protein
MPAMISILKIEPRVAAGKNLAASLIMGISGLLGQMINNNIDYIVLIMMGSGDSCGHNNVLARIYDRMAVM